ncbi:TQXA domain-containing protein [Streptomyces sp. 549]|uniref:Cys-Gln thioester bond-forming surface protein n=1 Tax=Streptomyces sp. 549 TaxID=3049076 RepID=UPI0024C44E7B|nr:TQXA domain-containing protein [Streptomyces sp. 549]MDK1474452.1 TQXA domain-containing protein [Streptomyces sp. 549]
MILIRGRATTRRVAAALASGLLAAAAMAVGAAPASAGPSTGAGPQPGGALATLDGLRIYDQAIIREGGETTETGAGLFEMSVAGGGSLQSYCIDMHNPTQEQARYQEVPWKTSSLHDNPDAGKIRWILQHSYPQVNDLAALAKASGARHLTPQTAAAGTQVAIWRYSDGADVSAADPNAEKLADHLHEAARDTAEPKASLTLDPPAVSGQPGGRLGPVTVRTGARSAGLTPAPDAAARGVRVVDADGEPVTSVRNGTQVWFDVPEDTPDGSTSVTVETVTPVPVGRAFTGIGENATSQTQILAGSSDATVTATATANWAASGPVPAVSAQKNCAAQGLDLTVANQGDEPFTFTIGEDDHTVAAGETGTVTVPVGEDQAYRITVEGPGGYQQTFAGVLDCATVSTGTGDAEGEGPSVQTAPVTVGGNTGPVNLAETGGGSDAPLLIGVAVGLLVLGAGAVYMVRSNRGGEPQAASDQE